MRNTGVEKTVAEQRVGLGLESGSGCIRSNVLKQAVALLVVERPAMAGKTYFRYWNDAWRFLL